MPLARATHTADDAMGLTSWAPFSEPLDGRRLARPIDHVFPGHRRRSCRLAVGAVSGSPVAVRDDDLTSAL